MFGELSGQLPHLKEKLEAFDELAERVEVPARTVLLREGEISRKAFFIEQGCLRIWFNNHGVDTTFQFAFEHQIVSSAESFRKNIPGLFTVETIEPSVLQVLSKKNYDLIMQEMRNEPDFLNMLIDSLFDRQLYYMQEFLSFVRDTPLQRYLNLLKEKPHILQRVPQHLIASYLGITPVHLSRIRNRILKDQKRSLLS